MIWDEIIRDESIEFTVDDGKHSEDAKSFTGFLPPPGSTVQMDMVGFYFWPARNAFRLT